MKVAAIQMVSSLSVTENLNTALDLLQEAANGGAKLAVLPEYFCAMPLPSTDKMNFAEYDGDLLNGPIQTMISQAAKRLNLWIVAGSIPLRSTDAANMVHNSCLVYDPKGEQVVRYDKIHLFRFDSGTEQYDESTTHLAGASPKTFNYSDEQHTLKCGLSICYDLRFPELYRALSSPNSKPCDILFVPSAFTYTTGQDHWEILLRARAIENQCYVIAAAQGGEHQNKRKTWGHSMIIDPWGEVLEVLESGEGVIFADIDSTRIQAVRTKLPALKNRMLRD